MKLPPWGIAGASLLLLCFVAFVIYKLVDRRKIEMTEIAFPVLLIDKEQIDEVCINTAELMLRHEYSEPRLEIDFLVIDANGVQYRFKDVHPAEKRPSVLKRVFNATIYKDLRFNVTFTLRKSGKATPEMLENLLGDRELPVHASSLAERFTGFRERRFAKYGHLCDRWPGTWAKTEETEPQKEQ